MRTCCICICIVFLFVSVFVFALSYYRDLYESLVYLYLYLSLYCICLCMCIVNLYESLLAARPSRAASKSKSLPAGCNKIDLFDILDNVLNNILYI